MESCGAVHNRYGVPRTSISGELSLETIDEFSYRRYVSRVETFLQIGPLISPEERLVKELRARAHN